MFSVSKNTFSLPHWEGVRHKEKDENEGNESSYNSCTHCIKTTEDTEFLGRNLTLSLSLLYMYLTLHTA